MCNVASTTGASTASGPVRHTSRYTHFVAKDSDSDSEIEEPQRVDTQDKAGCKAMTTSFKLTKVPDFNGVRFCRVCKQFLPIGMFPRGQRRFTCRPHLWQRIGKKSKKALLTKPRKKLLAAIWTRCYKDARLLGLSLVLKQKDIDRMLDTLEEQSSNVCIDEVALLPKELSVPVSKDNTALVSEHERQALIDKLCRTRRLLKAKPIQDKPLEAYQGYQEQENAENKLASLWRKKVVSLALIPPDVCA